MGLGNFLGKNLPHLLNMRLVNDAKYNFNRPTTTKTQPKRVIPARPN